MFQDVMAMDAFLQQKISRCRLLVVGDVMLDRYYYGEVRRISPEAPVPVTRVIREQETLGGAANVAHNLALLGCQVFLAGMAGRDENRVRLVRLLSDIGIEDGGLVDGHRPTTTKLRVIGGHQQMLRLDFEDTRPLTPATDRRLRGWIDRTLAAGVDGVVISDYGKGLCTPGLCQYVIRCARQAGVPVIVDPKGANWKKYSEASLVTPNLKEIGEAIHKAVANNDKAVKNAADKIRKRLRLDALMVTRSEQGLSLVDDRLEVHIPTRAQEVFDVSGAGDTVIAVMGAALAGGIGLADAAQLSNLAAGVVVAKVGTYAISRQELSEAVKNFMVADI
ncbi:MAG TPA: D-glycero-beta-D-manno-heptose-7-phosphate kinase [Patescibacteria group bacterium]|nr:D-glycero-beta-D-manno-heptose-7-phosphate kinase [Patescibacteria group bacterium]